MQIGLVEFGEHGVTPSSPSDLITSFLEQFQASQLLRSRHWRPKRQHCKARADATRSAQDTIALYDGRCSRGQIVAIDH